MEIPEKMADRAMREITDYYDMYPDNHIDKNFLIGRGVCQPDEVDALVKFLCSKGLIEYGPSYEGDWDNIRLINRHYLEGKKKERKASAKETRRFWIEVAKDVLIFLLGLIIEGKFGIIRAIVEAID